jgi:hypothetical protein
MPLSYFGYAHIFFYLVYTYAFMLASIFAIKLISRTQFQYTDSSSELGTRSSSLRSKKSAVFVLWLDFTDSGMWRNPWIQKWSLQSRELIDTTNSKFGAAHKMKNIVFCDVTPCSLQKVADVSKKLLSPP